MNRRLWIAVVGVLLAFMVLLAELFDSQINKGVFIFLMPMLAVLLGVFSVE